MKWKGASDSEGVALRLQLMSGDRKGEDEKFDSMVELHKKLMK